MNNNEYGNSFNKNETSEQIHQTYNLNNKKHSKWYVIVITILVIFVISLTGYITYDKLIAKEKENNCNTNIDNESKTNNIINAEVEDAFKFSSPKGACSSLGCTTKDINVEVPKVTEYSKNISEFNNKMMDEITSKTYIRNAMDLESSYQYIKKNNVIVIYVKGNLLTRETNYIYDLENDKEIGILEAVQKMNYTMNDVKFEGDTNKYSTISNIEDINNHDNNNGCDAYTRFVIDENKNVSIMYNVGTMGQCA